MAAAFPFTVSTTGRLLFLSCFMKSPDRRRKVVSDWISLVMSSMGLLLLKQLFRCYQNTPSLQSGKGLVSIAALECTPKVRHQVKGPATLNHSIPSPSPLK